MRQMPRETKKKQDETRKDKKHNGTVARGILRSKTHLVRKVGITVGHNLNIPIKRLEDMDCLWRITPKIIRES